MNPFGGSKYGNRKVMVDGIKFDSKLEARRYQELKLLERAGEIKHLRRQVEFVLQPSFQKNGKTIRKISYIADFVYIDQTGQFHIEDSKGFRTEIFRLKKKLFDYKYPHLNIEEVKK